MYTHGVDIRVNHFEHTCKARIVRGVVGSVSGKPAELAMRVRAMQLATERLLIGMWGVKLWYLIRYWHKCAVTGFICLQIFQNFPGIQKKSDVLTPSGFESVTKAYARSLHSNRRIFNSRL